jgi:beta-glucosidase
MVGATMQGLQAQHVIGDIKHYAVNDQESGRTAVNSLLNKRALRETDLLAFEIGLRISHAGAVMCSYNRVNGDYACENKYLLTDVLKKDWGFSGFVLSDWMATHSTVKASAAGLDNEEPSENFYGEALKQAVQSGRVPMAELDDHVRRILRTEFACGVVDDPPVKSVLDVEGGLRIAQRLAEQSIVLLQNKNGLLPLDAAKVRSIAVIGLHADVGMISGAGSAQVDAPLGNAVAPPGHVTTRWQDQIWFPTSPLKALRRMVPHANVQYNAGTDPDAAAVLAKSADVAIVFAYQWESEGMDLGNLTLPDNQDTLIERVAAANPHTIVVMETGGPMLMPWANQVSGIVEAWYAGSRGAWAVANVLFGKVNPTAKLPITFPLHEDELPPPGIVRPPEQSTEAHAWKKAQKAIAAGMPPAQAKLKVFADGFPAFPADYNQAALLVGYKWYDAKQLPVLFPFGYGLSYTTYAYSNLKVTPGQQETIRFTVRNTGKRAGAEVAEVYAALPASAGEPPQRLVGWSKVALQPGESKEVTVTAPREYLSIFNETKNGWELVPGTYTFLVGGSSQDLPLHQPVDLK